MSNIFYVHKNYAKSQQAKFHILFYCCQYLWCKLCTAKDQSVSNLAKIDAQTPLSVKDLQLWPYVTMTSQVMSLEEEEE